MSIAPCSRGQGALALYRDVLQRGRVSLSGSETVNDVVVAIRVWPFFRSIYLHLHYIAGCFGVWIFFHLSVRAGDISVYLCIVFLPLGSLCCLSYLPTSALSGLVTLLAAGAADHLSFG